MFVLFTSVYSTHSVFKLVHHYLILHQLLMSASSLRPVFYNPTSSLNMSYCQFTRSSLLCNTSLYFILYWKCGLDLYVRNHVSLFCTYHFLPFNLYMYYKCVDVLLLHGLSVCCTLMIFNFYDVHVVEKVSHA